MTRYAFIALCAISFVAACGDEGSGPNPGTSTGTATGTGTGSGTGTGTGTTGSAELLVTMSDYTIPTPFSAVGQETFSGMTGSAISVAAPDLYEVQVGDPDDTLGPPGGTKTPLVRIDGDPYCVPTFYVDVSEEDKLFPQTSPGLNAYIGCSDMVCEVDIPVASYHDTFNENDEWMKGCKTLDLDATLGDNTSLEFNNGVMSLVGQLADAGVQITDYSISSDEFSFTLDDAQFFTCYCL